MREVDIHQHTREKLDKTEVQFLPNVAQGVAFVWIKGLHTPPTEHAGGKSKGNEATQDAVGARRVSRVTTHHWSPHFV